MGPDSASLLLRVKMGLSTQPSHPQANDQTETRSSGQDGCRDDRTHGHSCMYQTVPITPLEQAGLFQTSHTMCIEEMTWLIEGVSNSPVYYAELLINTMENFIGKKISFAFNMRHSTWCLRKYLKALPEVKRIQVDPGRWNVNDFSVSINLLNKRWEWKLRTNERCPSWFTCPTAAGRTWFWVKD